MALASAKRFVEEGAYVFITGRRQQALDEVVKLASLDLSGAFTLPPLLLLPYLKQGSAKKGKHFLLTRGQWRSLA